MIPVAITYYLFAWFGSTDPDNLIHFTVPGTVAVLVAERLYDKYQKRRSGDSPPPINHKTFADDEERYWSKMRDVVTAPLAEAMGATNKVLEKTNEILGDLNKRAIKEDGRREVLDSLSKSASAGHD